MLTVILLASCGGKKSTNSLAPFQPQITNLQDDFSLQATAVQNVSGAFQYVWQNTGNTATVNQACSMTSGTALLKIYSDTTLTNLVYQRNLAANGDSLSSAGAPGSWLIRVELSNCCRTGPGADGNLNFRVQKI
jgi:hypothetical protein